MSTNEVRPEDALQVAQRALQKVNDLESRLEEQQETINNQHERIMSLEARQEDTSDYEMLDRDTKVGMVREHIVERAQNQHGKAAIDYNDVQWGVFEGEPSADHCYTLMELAANADGFNFEHPDGHNKRLTVNVDATNPVLGFSHANKDSTKGAN